MNSQDDWKRVIEAELESNGFTGYTVATRVDAENKVVIEIHHENRVADGLPDLVLSAIHDASRNGIPLPDAFDARNMYAPAI